MASSRGKAERQSVQALPPVVDERSRVLILGSMPSPLSREQGYHYGNPQNRFWRVICGLWGEEVPPTREGKRAFCLQHGLALDDVLLACTIVGASDASIADPVPNDLSRVLSIAPIKAVFCTGGTAARLYKRYVQPLSGLPCTGLPSTSPANARWRLPDLLEAYAPIRAVADAAKAEQTLTTRCRL